MSNPTRNTIPTVQEAKNSISQTAHEQIRQIVSAGLDCYEPMSLASIQKGASTGIMIAVQNGHNKVTGSGVSMNSPFASELRTVMADSFIDAYLELKNELDKLIKEVEDTVIG